MKNIKFSEVTITNTTSTDMYVRDAYGMEHVIYPEQAKKLVVIETKKKLVTGKTK